MYFHPVIYGEPTIASAPEPIEAQARHDAGKDGCCGESCAHDEHDRPDGAWPDSEKHGCHSDERTKPKRPAGRPGRVDAPERDECANHEQAEGGSKRTSAGIQPPPVHPIGERGDGEPQHECRNVSVPATESTHG